MDKEVREISRFLLRLDAHFPSLSDTASRTSLPQICTSTFVQSRQILQLNAIRECRILICIILRFAPPLIVRVMLISPYLLHREKYGTPAA